MSEQHSQFDIFICKHLSFTLCHSFLFLFFFSFHRKKHKASLEKSTAREAFSSETNRRLVVLCIGWSEFVLFFFSTPCLGFIPGHLNQHTHTHTHTHTHIHTHTHTHTLSLLYTHIRTQLER